MTYKIEDITTILRARRVGEAATVVRWLLTDSRSLCFPEESLFFALVTTRGDGHRYVADLYARGVRNFVVSRLPDETGEGANYLIVDDTLAALQRLAGYHRTRFDVPVAGITGSNGKTMVKEWLHQLLAPQTTVTRSPRSYNSQVGVPLSLWLIDDTTQVALIEAGISMPGEMARLRDIIRPTIGIMTSLGTAHQEHFPSMEAKCREKLLLFSGADALIYNADDPVVCRCVDDMDPRIRRVAWSRRNSGAAMFVSHVETQGDTTTVTYIYEGVNAAYTLPFIDYASVECSIAAAVAALFLGVERDDLCRRMALLEPVAMRLEVKEGQRGCTIINDTYNSDIGSLDIALDFMSRRPDVKGRRRTLILSDIYQSGMAPADLYAQVSKTAVARGVEKFIGIGTQLTANADRIETPCKHFFPDVSAFVASGMGDTLHDEVILVKGARSFGFELIAELLERRVHETVLYVNLGAIVANLNHYRSMLRPSTKMVCMVKADAYGAGAVEVAKTLQDHRVDYLAVAVADEGVTLRKNGITANIMVMNPEMSALPTIFRYSLEPEVYSFRIMDALIRAAQKEGITGWPVHIKIDTGMHRLGFDPIADIDTLVSRLRSQNAIMPRSVFSHFAGADSDDFDTFSDRQYELFIQASARLQEAFSHKILRHIDNSAGIEHFPERQLEMCRLGLGLYGIDSRDNSILHNVSTLQTTILQLRHVKRGDTVGYSRRGMVNRDSVIAALPIGYADGLDRRLGCGAGYCLVNGMKAPYVGNICMDVALADVTGIPCHEGDKAEIFGDQLPVTVLSDTLSTIPYEVLTGVSNRVKRVYIQE